MIGALAKGATLKSPVYIWASSRTHTHTHTTSLWTSYHQSFFSWVCRTNYPQSFLGYAQSSSIWQIVTCKCNKKNEVFPSYALHSKCKWTVENAAVWDYAIHCKCRQMVQKCCCLTFCNMQQSAVTLLASLDTHSHGLAQKRSNAIQCLAIISFL